jgi:hypothetical protein
MNKTTTSQNSSYTFTSSPRAVGKAGKKYRDPTDKRINLMNDPRVRRGITVASVHSTYIESTPEEIASIKRDTRRKDRSPQSNRPATPEAVDGRQHMEIQTENFLEELTDRPVEKDRETQTDVFMDRPPSPLFIPKKSGVDISTQVLPGELFDFDREVEPILSQLIAKTLEQSLMEVRDEEELRNLKVHQVTKNTHGISNQNRKQCLQEEPQNWPKPVAWKNWNESEKKKNNADCNKKKNVWCEKTKSKKKLQHENLQNNIWSR